MYLQDANTKKPMNIEDDFDVFRFGFSLVFSSRTLATNLYIGETNFRIYTQKWVDWRRFVSLYCCIKCNNFFLQVIKRTFYLLNTFRTNVCVNFGGFAAAVPQ